MQKRSSKLKGVETAYGKAMSFFNERLPDMLTFEEKQAYDKAITSQAFDIYGEGLKEWGEWLECEVRQFFESSR